MTYKADPTGVRFLAGSFVDASRATHPWRSLARPPARSRYQHRPAPSVIEFASCLF